MAAHEVCLGCWSRGEITFKFSTLKADLELKARELILFRAVEHRKCGLMFLRDKSKTETYYVSRMHVLSYDDTTREMRAHATVRRPAGTDMQMKLYIEKVPTFKELLNMRNLLQRMHDDPYLQRWKIPHTDVAREFLLSAHHDMDGVSSPIASESPAKRLAVGHTSVLQQGVPTSLSPSRGKAHGHRNVSSSQKHRYLDSNPISTIGTSSNLTDRKRIRPDDVSRAGSSISDREEQEERPYSKTPASQGSRLIAALAKTNNSSPLQKRAAAVEPSTNILSKLTGRPCEDQPLSKVDKWFSMADSRERMSSRMTGPRYLSNRQREALNISDIPQQDADFGSRVEESSSAPHASRKLFADDENVDPQDLTVSPDSSSKSSYRSWTYNPDKYLDPDKALSDRLRRSHMASLEGEIGLAYRSSSKFPRRKNGLLNLGNTCYFNAVLQCFLHLPPVRKSVVALAPIMNEVQECTTQVHEVGSPKGVEDSRIPTMLFTLTFLQLLDTFRINEKASHPQPLDPSVLHDVLRQRWQVFEGVQQHDAHELYSAFLDMFESDSNDIQKFYSPSSPEALELHGHVGEYHGQNVGRRNPQGKPEAAAVLPQFPHTLFSGKLRRAFVCVQCHHSWHKVDGFYELSLDMIDPESESVKSQKLDVQTLLHNFLSTGSLLELICPKCKHTAAEVRDTLDKLPNILCLHIKRFCYSPSLPSGDAKLSPLSVSPVWTYEKRRDPVRLTPTLSLYKYLSPDTGSDGNEQPPPASRNPSSAMSDVVDDCQIVDSYEEDVPAGTTAGPYDSMEAALRESRRSYAKEEQTRLAQAEQESIEEAIALSIKQQEEEAATYELACVVGHLGTKATSGHYVADVYDRKSQTWTHFDDSTSFQVTEEEVFGPSRQKACYMLLYVKKMQ